MKKGHWVSKSRNIFILGFIYCLGFLYLMPMQTIAAGSMSPGINRNCPAVIQLQNIHIARNIALDNPLSTQLTDAITSAMPNVHVNNNSAGARVDYVLDVTLTGNENAGYMMDLTVSDPLQHHNIAMVNQSFDTVDDLPSAVDDISQKLATALQHTFYCIGLEPKTSELSLVDNWQKQITAHITDLQGNPVNNRMVHFHVDDYHAGTLTPNASDSNNDGDATTIFYGPKAFNGNAHITAEITAMSDDNKAGYTTTDAADIAIPETGVTPHYTSPTTTSEGTGDDTQTQSGGNQNDTIDSGNTTNTVADVDTKNAKPSGLRLAFKGTLKIDATMAPFDNGTLERHEDVTYEGYVPLNIEKIQDGTILISGKGPVKSKINSLAKGICNGTQLPMTYSDTFEVGGYRKKNELAQLSIIGFITPTSPLSGTCIAPPQSSPEAQQVMQNAMNEYAKTFWLMNSGGTILSMPFELGAKKTFDVTAPVQMGDAGSGTASTHFEAVIVPSGVVKKPEPKKRHVKK